MSGIWFGDVKTLRCSKAVINECQELARCSGCFRQVCPRSSCNNSLRSCGNIVRSAPYSTGPRQARPSERHHSRRQVPSATRLHI